MWISDAIEWNLLYEFGAQRMVRIVSYLIRMYNTLLAAKDRETVAFALSGQS